MIQFILLLNQTAVSNRMIQIILLLNQTAVSNRMIRIILLLNQTAVSKVFGRTLKERHVSGNKGNFESGQNKSEVCSFILKQRECTPLFVTMDTSCESGQNKSEVCSFIPIQRECNRLFVTMDTSCKLYYKTDNIL